MHFAYPIPWWLAIVLAAAIGGLAFVAYRRPIVPLTPTQRAVLTVCRALVLGAIVLFVCRPIVLVPPSGGRGAIVPVLVDVSRSMRLSDADGQTRIARATELLRTELMPALSRQFSPELYSVGERLEPASLDRLSGDGRRSDLGGALAAVRERYRGQRVAGIVLLSDGGDTGRSSTSRMPAVGAPVFAIGLGTPDTLRDREIVGMTAGDQRLDQASVDLRVSAVSSGFGRAPFQLRLLANGRELESRRVVPPADGAPIEETFTVSPDPTIPTAYTAEIPVDQTEVVGENNSRSVLVNPAGGKRRILVIEGAPGFEHSFMKRAWSSDTSLELDSVGRKGKNADGQDTFFVQAAAPRAAALTRGFPLRREDLYVYDGLVIANVEGDFFTRAQLAMMADFVAERGGGLLVMGGRSFGQRGLAGTPLEEVLPVELDARRGAFVRTPAGGTSAGPPNKVPNNVPNKLIVTSEGENHPVMRIGDSPEETRRRWAALPALAASAPLGAARPGATILAVATATTGAMYPVIAVQRYGQGRSMTFSGEASWRWRMMLASTDRSYEFFWRQAARWIAGPSPGAVTITVPDDAGIGDDVSIEVDVRDAAFAPVGDATVGATVTGPGGESRPITLGRPDRAPGRYDATVRVDRPGMYRVDADVRRGAASLGRALRWWYVGGTDREFADPRLNEPWLRRVARQSGGRYVRPPDVSRIAGWLKEGVPGQVAPERRDLWHEPWAFVAIVALLSAEWILRRRWGLR
jgi:uncharacterized membrane protein